MNPEECKDARILWLIVFGAAFFLVQLGSRIGAGAVNLPLAARTPLGYLVVYIFGLIAAAVFVRSVWRWSPRDATALLSMRWKGILVRFWVALTVTMLATGAVEALILALLGTPIYSPTVWHSLSWRRVSISDPSWSGTILVATAEEVIFRGVIFNYLWYGTSRWRMARATLGSALIFALVHQLHDPLSWFSMDKVPLLIGLILLGVLLAVGYATSGSLACAAGIHTGLGWIGLLNGKTHLEGLLRASPLMGRSMDLRTAPAVWLLFVGLTIAWRMAGRSLRKLPE